MINHGYVCVVDINSRVCCLAAPGDQEGCVVSPRRARELMSTTPTYPWLIPIITWCWPYPFVSTNILLIKSKLKLESRAIAVGVACHHVILVASIAVAPTPGCESSRASVCGKQSVLIELHQSGVIAWWPWQHRQSCGVFKAEFLWHTVLSNENGEFYTYGIYPYLNRSVCLLMGSPTWWRFNFCSSGSCLVCSMMTWRTARARISNVRSPM